jgi:DNA recombination protein RmuC
MEWLIGGIVGTVLGGAVGGLGAYVYVARRAVALQTAAALAEQRGADLANRLDGEKRSADALRQELAASQQRTATLAAELRAAQQNLVEQKRLLDDAQARLKDAFASVSAEALAKNNEAFLQLAKERFATLSTEAAGTLDERKAQIETLLKPMQELMAQYQLRLGEIEKSRVESYSMLREQLGTLAEVQRTLNTQTTQLVSALRRPTTRGQWGEVTLRRLVELSGMASRCDFFEQVQVSNGEDGKLRPDMVIRLPGSREIIVDCKASLDGFLDAAAAADDDMRKVHLQRHGQQVRARAKELCAKSYWTQFKNAPEYVVMFLPGESFFSAAVESDQTLYEDCLKSHVIVATPTTLLALLKTVARIWQQEDMTENAEKIRTLGVELYERIAVLAGHMDALGSSIGKTVSTYNQAIASMESRVLVTARKMSELGAKTDKPLPEATPVDTQPRELSASLRSLPS